MLFCLKFYYLRMECNKKINDEIITILLNMLNRIEVLTSLTETLNR